MSATIDKLIINSAFREPEHYWKYDLNKQSFVQEQGRRPAGYFVANTGVDQYNDVGTFIPLPVVNIIRERVKAWRNAGYPGTTSVTKQLLEHWNNKDMRQYQFFFCQMDAIETLIWLVEAPETERAGINIQGDGGVFKRICTKLCTGGGKTTVMAMLIAWMVCNKVAYPRDTRFAKNVFIVAPGLTVKSRLQVLKTNGQDNYYNQFKIVPPALLDKLYKGRVRVVNWQMLAWETEEQIKKRKGVDKRGVKSDEAYTREILGDIADAKNLLVINDEAHHAWRKNANVKTKIDKDAEQQATIWISGLDRLHKTRKILTCYDFSATPFVPGGRKGDEEALFSWIVSDFGLTDGIESGLVKTPRVVVRDDGQIDTKTFKSKLYHIYSDRDVKDDINRAVDETTPLPDLINQAYYLLGKDWEHTYQEWKKEGSIVPPVMITVANRTETSSRIRHAFETQRIAIPELCKKEYLLQIDSKILESKREEAESLREKVDTVGQRGKPGEQIRNIISVGMLTEGWDAKTVTHILGLRAFTSQLLCEQVVGRGLRRTSYDLEDGTDMFAPEYVNIFGIPFTFLPAENAEGGKASIPKPKTQIEALADRGEYEIMWPNVIRIERELKPELSIDLSHITPLELNAFETRIRADLAPIIDGKTDMSKLTEIDLQKLSEDLRMQKIVFETTRDIYDMMQAKWKKEGTKIALFGQVVKLVNDFLESDKIIIEPRMFAQDKIKTNIILMMNMTRIVEHLWQFIQLELTTKITPILDQNRKILSTALMPTWYSSKPCVITQKSQISHCVHDCGWEATGCYILEKNKDVVSWAKNDHLGFEIGYIFKGSYAKYRPDFLIRLSNGKTLVLEVKGEKRDNVEAKKKALEEWIDAINASGEYGVWCSDICYNPAELDNIIAKHVF